MPKFVIFSVKIMITREFWLKKINVALNKRSIVWLPGVRRTGKTSLCKSIADSEYFDCELPRIRRMMEDPEAFLQDHKGKKIILDEIHRLGNPSELLKIAADYHPDIKIIATGSSTLSASKKFKDTLTGRKTKIWLPPMLYHEGELFGNSNIEHRLLHGGLPPFFTENELAETEFAEWMDDYWAKDIQELFNIVNKHSFQKFIELILANSGGIFEATQYATPCEVSRNTINKYLHILEQTYVAHIIRPYSKRAASEIISAPKVYGFDTGFVCHYRGWTNLRHEDLGYLFEHFVLNELLGRFQKCKLQYWRDKTKNEIDFIFSKNRHDPPIAIECKWSANSFNGKSMNKFRGLHPEGENFLVAADVDKPYTRYAADLKINVVGIADLITRLE